jgi:hypothetical protein
LMNVHAHGSAIIRSIIEGNNRIGILWGRVREGDDEPS